MNVKDDSRLGRENSVTPIISLAPHLKPDESKLKREAQIQDFNLSIGTISVTIEGTEKKPDKIPPRRAQTDNRSGSDNSGTRLSRHYIRTR